MVRHVSPGGVLIAEPYIRPEDYLLGTVHAVFVNEPELKIARIGTSGLEDRVSVGDFHYLVGTPGGIEHFTEHHELALFTHEEYLTAFQEVGLEVIHDAEGLIGRGLYIGIRPLA